MFSVMCFFFLPWEELNWFKQLEFRVGEGREIMKNGGCPLDTVANHSTPWWGPTALVTIPKWTIHGSGWLKFSEENEYGWIQMNDWGFIGSSRHGKHQWWLVFKLKLYLSVGMDRHAMSICWQSSVWSFLWPCEHACGVHACRHRLCGMEGEERGKAIICRAVSYSRHLGVEQKLKDSYFSTHKPRDGFIS